MAFHVETFIRTAMSGKKKMAIPIMTSPGIALAGAKVQEVFRNGELQFKCIRTLSKEFPADAHVTFMDLSVEAETFGCPIQISEHENPTVSGPTDIDHLRRPRVGEGRTGEILKCAKLCAENLERPVFGGMIGPYSLAGRLAGMTEMMMHAAGEPEIAHRVLEHTAAFLTEYALAIKATGVSGLLVAEPAAGLLSPEMCQAFAADYLKKIFAAVKDDSFMIILHNCGRTEKQVGALLSTGAHAIHVGNAVKITDILAQVPSSIPVMGNLDPVSVFKTASPETVYARTIELLNATAAYPNHILSSGCDLPPGIPFENIRAFFKAREDFFS